MKNFLVGIVAYNRSDKTINLVNKVINQGYYPIVFIDGHKNQHTENEQYKIIEHIKSIPYVRYYHQEYNLGLRKNIFFACQNLSLQSNYFILLEDDIDFNSNSIMLIEKNLLYLEREGVVSITAGTPPWFNYEDITLLAVDVFVPWAVVMSSKVWKEFYNNINYLNNNFTDLNRYGSTGKFLLSELTDSNNSYSLRDDVWSIYWHAYWLLMNKKFGLLSKAIFTNNGLNDNGVHIQNKVGLESKLNFTNCDIQFSLNKNDSINQEAVNKFIRYWKNSYLLERN